MKKNNNNTYDVIIIGGGIIGSSINYKLAKFKGKVLQFEKNPYLAFETTKVNSGCLHGGFDAKTGKNTAKYNVLGLKKWVDEIFKDLDFPRKQIDSLVISFSPSEHQEIQNLYQRGLDNKCDPKTLEIIDQKKLRELEPNISKKAYSALRCTSSWMIDPVEASRAFVGSALKNGNEYKNNSQVINIVKNKNFFEVKVNNVIYKAKCVVNASGHYANKISQMVKGESLDQKIRRGQYLFLNKNEASKVKNICFKVPTIYGKGVLVAPMLSGQVLVGPTATYIKDKEEARLIDTKVWKKIEKIGNDVIPKIDYSKVELSCAASRPVNIETNDLIVKKDVKINGLIHCVGMKSPAISGAPAIADDVVKMIQSLGLMKVAKNNYDPKFKVIW